MRIELDAIGISQFFRFRGRIQSNAQDHQVELLLLDTVVGRRVFYGYILAVRDLFSDGYVTSDKANPWKVLRSLVELFEIFAI